MKYPMVIAYAKLKGLTVEDLAKELNITKRTLQNKINGRTDFTFTESRTLCILLEKSSEDIFLTKDVSPTIQP